MKTKIEFVIIATVLIVFVLASGCVDDDTTEVSNSEKACVETGGEWAFSECNGHCTPDTKEERLSCEGEGGCACTTVCISGYRCNCPTGMNWGSKEEGCIAE